jgi:hypothetical protein
MMNTKSVKFGDTEVELLDADDVNGFVETVVEEVDNETFTKEVNAQKAKAEGKGKKAEVAKASVQAVKQEEVEHLDELSKSTLGSYVKKASHSSNDSQGDSVKAGRESGVTKAAYRTQGLAHKKGTDGFRKYKAESVELDERTLTAAETKEKEMNVKGMKKNLSGFKARYGDKAKSVMYATATKQAKKD